MAKSFKEFNTKRYTCLECGECCTAWNLPVEKELYEKIIDHEWVKNLLIQEKENFKITSGNIFLPKKNKVCIFKDNNNLCLLQKNNGVEYKPLECQRFPFAFAKDANGKIYTDTSFFCKAIIKNKGVVLTEALKEEYSKQFDCFEIPEQINLSFKKKITFKEFQEIRDLVNTYLFEKCISSNVEKWPQYFINAYKHIENYNQNREIEDLNIKSSSLKYSLLTSIFLRKKNIIPDAFRIFKGKGHIQEPIIAESIDLTILNSIKIPEDNKIKETFLRYLMDINQRNILHAHNHNFTGILLITIFAYNLTLWYSKALTSVQSGCSIELFHIELAIRIMERYYIGHNVRFLENFRLKRKYEFLKILCL